MLLSLAIIFIGFFIIKLIFNKLNIPELVGMILLGILLGQYHLNLISDELLYFLPLFSQFALVIILTNGGLELDINSLRKVGKPVIFMCFFPALIEILGVALFAPLILGVSFFEAAVMGAVLGAVSPAIIVPRMIKLIEEGYGKEHGIPELLLAVSSIDDIFVIILFTSLMGIYIEGEFTPSVLLNIPISIVGGIVFGIIAGNILLLLFKKIHMRDTQKIILLICTSFLLLSIEETLSPYVKISGLLASTVMGCVILNKNKILAERLSLRMSKIWFPTEILLFVMLGSTVNIDYLVSGGLKALCVVLIGLLFRVLATEISLMRTNLTVNEKVYCSISSISKGTVQASIGSIPLMLGMPCGEMVLSLAIISILVTSPVGATLMDCTYKKLLTKKWFILKIFVVLYI